MYKVILFISLLLCQPTFSQIVIPEDLPEGITQEFIAQIIRNIDETNEVTALLLQAESLRIISPNINTYLENVLKAFLDTGKEVRIFTHEQSDSSKLTRLGAQVKTLDFIGTNTVILLDNRQVLIGGGLLDLESNLPTQWIDMTKTHMTLSQDFETLWSMQ